MKEFNDYPDRLIGWVRVGNQVYELRLNHEPNLFYPNLYVLQRIFKTNYVPFNYLLDEAIVFPVATVNAGTAYKGEIVYPDGYILKKWDSELLVEFEREPYMGRAFILLRDTNGTIRLRLRALPRNIR